MSTVLALGCVVVVLGLGIVVSALSRMATDEVRSRIERVPLLVLRFAVWLAPAGRRAEMRVELEGELYVACNETDGLPVTRLVRGLSFSLGHVLDAVRGQGCVALAITFVTGVIVPMGTAIFLFSQTGPFVFSGVFAASLLIATLDVRAIPRVPDSPLIRRVNRLQHGSSALNGTMCIVMTWAVIDHTALRTGVTLLIVAMQTASLVFVRRAHVRRAAL